VEGITVTHHLKAGLNPSWTGSARARSFGLDGGRSIVEHGKREPAWERAVKHA
jgi:hypothetical protein